MDIGPSEQELNKIKELEAEIKELKEQLQVKNDNVFKELKAKIEETLDLDAYNITSDDFREKRKHQTIRFAAYR